jgi:hypothetical protein
MASILKVNTIQDATNSNTALSIDSSGRVARPVRVGFKIGASTHNQTSALTGNITQYNNLRTTVGDFNDGAYNTTTCVYTVPVAGVYMMGCHAFSYGENHIEVLIRQNDVAVGGNQQNGSNDESNYEVATLATITNCAVGDTLAVYSNATKYHLNTQSSFFYAFLIG